MKKMTGIPQIEEDDIVEQAITIVRKKSGNMTLNAESVVDGKVFKFDDIPPMDAYILIELARVTLILTMQMGNQNES